MKVLMITPYLPYPLYSGGQIRSYNLIKNLAKSHEITLFAFVKEVVPDHIRALEKFCKKIEVFKRRKAWSVVNILVSGFSFYPFLVAIYYSLSLRRRIKEELFQNKYDLIHAETFYVMPNIPQTRVPILLVEQTIEYLVYAHFLETLSLKLFKPLLALDIFKLKFWEKFYWKRADKVVAMSASDKIKMRKLVPNLSVEIVPNGVDASFFSQVKQKSNKSPVLLFVGNFSWLQNREAVGFLIEKIWPNVKAKIQNAQLLIVGRNPSDGIKSLVRKFRVQMESKVDDIREAYSKSDVMIAPIFGPGGTRYKILEAMAASLPVITTEMGAEGLPVKHQEHILIANEQDMLIEQTIKLLKNEKLRIKISQNAKLLVQREFDWKKISSKLDKLYKSVGSA